MIRVEDDLLSKVFKEEVGKQIIYKEMNRKAFNIQALSYKPNRI